MQPLVPLEPIVIAQTQRAAGGTERVNSAGGSSSGRSSPQKKTKIKRLSSSWTNPKAKRYLIMAARLGLVCLPVIGLIAFLIAAFFNAINIDESAWTQAYRDRMKSDLKSSDNVMTYRNAPPAGQTTNQITDLPDHLMWFMQISDLHLSKYFDPGRKTDLYTFATQVVDAVRPDAVVATGDLTDARNRNPLGSDQHIVEWIAYHDVLEKSGVTDKVPWLDIRGNHDSLNVVNWESGNNYYRNYSNIGGKHSSSFKYVITANHSGFQSKYTFIGIDACPTPGARRPFNFIGLVNRTELDRLQEMATVAERDTEYTVWFGHYPTSSLATPSPGIRHVIRGPYLSGHYHTFGGLVPQMYATQSATLLEAEVADWKKGRHFRVGAIDHSMFSWTDTKLGQWPIIVITNPKRSREALPGLEPLNLIRDSSHIRALIFSPHRIASVQCQIDDGDWIEMDKPRHESTPLWTMPWDPLKYLTGLHYVRVRATDASNTTMEENHFSLDGSKKDFSFGAKFLIRWWKRSLGLTLFTCSVIGSVFPLLVLRLALHYNYHRFLRVKSNYSFTSRALLKYFLLAANNKTFWPLILIPLYACVGPWYVGEMSEGHLGIMFVWGFYCRGVYLPTGFSYIFASIQLIIVHMPLTLIAANMLYLRYQDLEQSSSASTVSNVSQASSRSQNRNHSSFTCFRFVLNALYTLTWLLGCLFISNYGYAYGWLSVVTGVFVAWPSLIYLYTWRTVQTADAKSFPASFASRLLNGSQKQPLQEGEEEVDQEGDGDDESGLPLR